MIECDQTCPWGEECANQRIQRRIIPSVKYGAPACPSGPFHPGFMLFSCAQDRPLNCAGCKSFQAAKGWVSLRQRTLLQEIW